MLSHIQSGLRAKPGKQFRKKLGVFNFKRRSVHGTHKRPGLIDVAEKEKLYKVS